jgi:hypothetical protein
MNLSSRFAVDSVFVVGGAFLAVSAMAFSASVAGWVGFGVFTGLTVLAAASTLFGRGLVRRASHSLLGLVALWSLIAALAFSGSALTWLVFAGAVALGVIALGDLTAHEVTTENVVHQLVVTDGSTAGEQVSRAA